MNQDVENTIASLRSLACTHKKVAWDDETTDLNPLVGEIRLVQFAVAGQAFVFDLFTTERETYLPTIKWVLENEEIVKIVHNAKFDSKYVMYKLGIEPRNLADTMLMSQILAAGDVTAQHGLDDCALQWLGITLDKSHQTSDWSGELSKEQLQYAVNDVLVLEPLYDIFIAQMNRRSLRRCGTLENEAVVPIADIELTGFPLDRQLWSELLERKIAKRNELALALTEAMRPGIDWETKNPNRYKRPLKPKLKKKDEGYAEAMAQYQLDMEAWKAVPKTVGGLINLGSHPQIKAALSNITGLDWAKLTTKDHVLALYTDRFPIVAQLQEYRSADKLVTGYGENWLARLDSDGRIRADFRQIGAETGRMACGGGVNLQNPPNDHNPGGLCKDGCKCHRGCFVAPEGRCFIISDYSQIELRIAANYSQDPMMMAAFNSGEDLHKFTASIMFNVAVADVTKEQRDLAKRANFLTVYGGGARKLSGVAGISIHEAEAVLEKYFATYSRLDTWLRFLARQAQEHRYTRTGSGRIVRYFNPEPENAHEQIKVMAAIGRNGKNAPIQGTSADILKRALRLLYEELRGTTAKIVNVIHDEIVVEVDTGSWLQPTIEGAMIKAGEEYITRVPVLVESKVSTRWIK